jgi:hypothetical protein
MPLVVGFAMEPIGAGVVLLLPSPTSLPAKHNTRLGNPVSKTRR